MVDEYSTQNFEAWLDSLFKEQPPELLFTNFICGAANKTRDPVDGKFCKNSHQYRLSVETIVNARNILENAGLDNLTSFREILNRVIDLTRKTAGSDGVAGFGNLACYDFALHYAWSRGICPDVVYLHAGASEGLGYLMESEAGMDIVVLNDSKIGKFVEVGTLPEPIARLGAHQIENFLCVYHKNLEKFAALHPRIDKAGVKNGKNQKSKKNKR